MPLRLRAPGLVLAVLAAATFLAPTAARADESVVVLGIQSVEGDDELARSLTGALRHAASGVRDWQVSGAEVTLAQMSLAHGCADEPDVACLAQIATALSAQRVIYGILRRGGSGFDLSLSVFDATAGQIERSVSHTVPASQTDIDHLRGPARSLIDQLVGTRTGSLSVTTDAPGARVSIDDAPAGTTDGTGALVLPELAVGPHRLSITAERRQTWSDTISIAPGEDTRIDATLAPAPDPGGGDSVSWVGIGFLAGGVVALGVAIYSMARINAINSDPTFLQYTDQYRSYYAEGSGNAIPGGETDVCREAGRGMMFPGAPTDGARTVASLCDEGSIHEVLQYVFVGIAAAAGAAGAVFLILDTGSGDGGERETAGGPSFMLTPGFGPEGASLQLDGRF